MKGHASEVDWQVSPVTTHLSFASPFHRSSEASINPPKKKTTPRRIVKKLLPFANLFQNQETPRREVGACALVLNLLPLAAFPSGSKFLLAHSTLLRGTHIRFL
ncbi:hypothetical protein NL676_014298, partial [Syzygium grande]